LWIRLKNRSKVIERTCLVEGDRPYSPSLDGASHGAVDGRPQGIPFQLGRPPEGNSRDPRKSRTAVLFSIGIPNEKKIERFRKKSLDNRENRN
jgi:hypothetical protein